MNQPDPAEIEAIAAEEMRDKWERYAARLNEGDGEGSFFGAAFIIAKSAVTDIPSLLAALATAEERAEDYMNRLSAAFGREDEWRERCDLVEQQRDEAAALAAEGALAVADQRERAERAEVRLALAAAVIEAAEVLYEQYVDGMTYMPLDTALANYHKATTKEEPNDEDR